MKLNKHSLAATLVLAAGLMALHGSSLAVEKDDPFQTMFHMSKMDKNKDGMVSKAEFMAMMGKAFDMHAQEKGIKGGKMNENQIEELERRIFTH